MLIIPDIVFLNNSLRQWIYAAVFIAGGYTAGKICSFILIRLLRRISVKAKRTVDDLLIASLKKPIAVLFFLAGLFFALGALSLPQTAVLWKDRVFSALFIVVVAWALSRVLNALIRRCKPYLSGAAVNQADLQSMFQKFCSILFWIITGVLVFRALGYNVSALMAGLGLGGAAIALASKDTLENFFGSITVFVDKSFKINDRIKIGDYDGTIIGMGIRTSKLRTLENRTVSIPNSLFIATPIENISSAPNFKVVQTVRLRGENGPEKIEQALVILKEIAASAPGLEGSPAVGLLSAGGLVCPVTFIYFVSKKADYMDTVSRINLTMLSRFRDEGIKLI
jgi:MscS family membrane protein